MTWKCTVCGYIHEGEEAPETCPVCSAPASVFERETSAASPASRLWKCTVCGYEHEGPEPPETCPVCGVPADQFTEVVAETPVPGQNPAAPRTVSEVMTETMVNWGVDTVFGMVGHSNLGLADAIRKQCEAGKLKYIGIRHEGAASFAASAYGKLTGKPAACLSIAGPGATNLLTGLWDARMDRVPVLALTGQIDTQVLGPGAFQEVDLASAFSSVACWSQTVLETSHHAELMNLALKNAILQRDVGHLIFPNEVQTLPVPNQPPGNPEGRLPDLAISPSASSLSQALERLNKAERPAIIVGHGARFEMDAVKKLAEKLNCPVITTFKAKGLIRDDDELGCGVLGRSGTPVSAHFMNSADLLLVFGASFSAHTGITPDIATVQVDRDPITLGKFHAVDVPMVGDIGKTAGLLLQGLEDPASKDRRTEIAEKKAKWKTEKQNRAAKDQGDGLNAAIVFETLSELIPENAVIAVDVGNNTYSFGRYFESKGQPVLMSGYLGSIGFGYPAAMGAWAAAPDRPIIALTGDGGFGQYMGELCTAVKYGMNITHILINNHELGKISTEQRMAEMTVWETGLHNPDFSAYAEICGAKGFRVTKADEIADAVKTALAHEGPALVEIMCDPELI
ncbi:thiamine pyrophosphate-dependent enzyme [Pontiella agarivorans]|uniref:Thiamine pyrophosphate-binding protein n=1 Tax=Pontiella agarivorans TaxID=3038953 RepID=A0ABU5MVP8_9BACT|nr:thiamine pyrophosphate-dependent enzyme [Pontiella agarivorans]MDZ8118311.1 thiamine pyrophosphate-binding protein [Pontiella agarivorans]